MASSLHSHNQSQDQVASPSNSQINTPPALDSSSVLFLEKLNATKIASDYLEYQILPGTYERVLDNLEAEDKELWAFVNFELRFELHDDERIIIKMPQSRLHGVVCGLLSNEITVGYKSILKNRDREPNSATRAFIKSIRPLFESDVRLEMTPGKKTILLPDHHWGLDNAEPAGLILEIACTQSFDKVKQKAKKYFVGSKFQIKMVIAVHVKEDFGVGMSVWRGVKLGQYWAMQPVMEQMQIETDSGPVEGYLAIPLGSFGPRWKVETLSIEAEVDREVRIPYSLIMPIVEDARRSYTNSRSLKYGPPEFEKILMTGSWAEMDIEETEGPERDSQSQG